MKNSRNQFSYRGFISILMAACFLGLAVSGIILYIAPPCSLAASINWSALSLSKVQWSSLHQVMALLILILALFHLFVYNWKSFTLYFKRNRIRRKISGLDEAGQSFFTKFRLPREVVAAIIGAVILYIGAILMISPFGWLHEGNDAIKDHYRQEYPERQGRGLGIGEQQSPDIKQAELHAEQPDTIFPETLLNSEFEEEEFQGRGQGQEFGQGDGQGRGLGQGERQGRGLGQRSSQGTDRNDQPQHHDFGY